MLKQAFTLTELMIVLIIVSILTVMGVVNYRATVVKSNQRLATRTLQLLFSREMMYADEYAGAGNNCASAAVCRSNLGLEISSDFPGNLCYNASCAGGCAQATGGTLGGNYYVSNTGTSGVVTAGQCPCACP